MDGDIKDINAIKVVDVDENEGEGRKKHDHNEMLYTIYDNPPWYIAILLGFQHYLTMFGATIAVPFVLAGALCMDRDFVGIGEIINTIFFVSGLCTLLQSTFGSRLPIVQGATFSFITPTIALLSAPPYGDCPDWDALNSTDYRPEWTRRLREVQGAIAVASVAEVFIGFTGLIGLVLRFIGPLTIAPTISLIGVSLFGAASFFASSHWWLALMTAALITIFSQYMSRVNLPCCRCSRNKGCSCKPYPFFKLFPVLLGITLSWFVCYMLTLYDVLPEGHKGRTDFRSSVLSESKWFRFPYPGQWGVPKVSAAGVLGLLAGVLASMIESVGDYYACARLAGAPPPPTHAINRGIGMEGIGCILAGLWGSGNGTTSYSENIGAIGITKVGSRRVVQFGALFMLVLGVFAKFGALFTTIPDPIIGGVFYVMFGMITAVGLSNLQFVDLNSSRNLFILGFSFFFGLSLPQWMSTEANANMLKTGVDELDQILRVLLSTSMFVGGFVAFFLDNTIPGTAEERGLLAWRRQAGSDEGEGATDKKSPLRCYDFPFGMRFIRRWQWTRYIPFCPTFNVKCRCCSCCKRTTSSHDLEMA